MRMTFSHNFKNITQNGQNNNKSSVTPHLVPFEFLGQGPVERSGEGDGCPQDGVWGVLRDDMQLVGDIEATFSAGAVRTQMAGTR